MEVTKQFKICKYSEGEIKRVADSVVSEYSLTIFINGQELITMLCTPKSLKFLVTGFLFSEGIIENIEQLKDIYICEKDGVALVELSIDLTAQLEETGFTRTVTSGCVGGMSVEKLKADDLTKIETNIRIDTDKVLKLAEQFNKKSDVFVKTGGVHSCALCTREEIIYFEEDIGRHNALEKILGKALLYETPFEDKIIFTSGRMSSEIIKKAAKLRVPFVVSRSAPTDAAIKLGEACGITLIGFARGTRMNIYTYANRIAGSPFGNSDD